MNSPRLLSIVGRNVMQQRSISVVPGPARVKISKAENFILTTILMTSLAAGPLWILAHMREYRGANK